MKKIAIYGAGGFGREVACLINKINEVSPTWELIGFFDDGVEKGTQISHFGPILGGMSDLNAWNDSLSVVIAIGNPTTVQKVVSKICNDKIEFPNLIHPNVNFSDKETFSIGKGNIVQHDCCMSCDVAIEDFNVLNSAVVFGHDVHVGSYNSFMPATRISGEVLVGNCNFFGVGSIVLQQIKIGLKVKVAAGSVLMTMPRDDSLYLGVPAKIVKF